VFDLFLADIDVCRNLDKKQRKVLHDFNIWRLKSLDLALDAAIDFESWEEATEFGKNFARGLKYAGVMITILSQHNLIILLLIADTTHRNSTRSLVWCT